MLPADLLVDLEKGDRSQEFMMKSVKKENVDYSGIFNSLASSLAPNMTAMQQMQAMDAMRSRGFL